MNWLPAVAEPSDRAQRRVVITGGARGIGAGLAASFAAGGFAVGLIGRDQQRLAETARTLEEGTPRQRRACTG
jgi:3-oxoacyl-[acyl-carrier protein] reductase